MNFIKETKALLKGKSGKKLVTLSVISFLVITVLVFFAVFSYCGNIHLKQIDEYFADIPDIIENYRNELRTRSRVYENEILISAELGLIVYNQENELADAERLERVRRAVSADSVSLVDGQGEVLSTTGPVSPAENYRSCVQSLEARKPHLEIYTAAPKDGEETGKNAGEGFVRLSVPGNTISSLVFEFSGDMMLELYNEFNDWSVVLERALTGGDASAYAKTGEKLTAYPADALTGDQASQLKEDLAKVFQNSGSIWHTDDGRPVKFVTLLGHRYLGALMQYDQEDTEILLTVPLGTVIGNGIYVAAAISICIGFGIVLFQIYVFCRLQRKKAGGNANSITRKWAWQTTRPGILAVLAVTIVFSYMLLELENRTLAAVIATDKRMDVQYEIDLRKSEEMLVRSTFMNCYLNRTEMLASFLTEHPDYQTRAGLEKLNTIAKADYLMLFDSTGDELVSSNSYTGFSFETNLSEEYRAVLLGYPYATKGPTADPYTGLMQLGTAVLITDSEGQSDGFLLAVYSAGDLIAELRRTSYAKTVNSYPALNGHIAAAISNEDGLFIAHTDPGMIGQKAEDVLPDFKIGSSFEGFTDYKDKKVCMSAEAADGKTLLYIVPERGDSYAGTSTGLAAVAILLILALVYYPNASVLTVRAMAEAQDKIEHNTGKRSPMKVIFDGYSIFLTLFAIFVLIAAYKGWWTSFDYIFNRQWSNGVHLFSIWSALLILSITFCFVFLIQTALDYLESRHTPQGQTVVRLAKSLVAYAASFYLAFHVLSIFGVNTTALLASAGIISIAAGMGAQSMAADLLAGFFMLLEGTVHVGDRVSISGITGCVTDIGIRTTQITDEDGNVVVINNSKVSPLRNMSQSRSKPKTEKKPENKPENGSRKALEAKTADADD